MRREAVVEADSGNVIEDQSHVTEGDSTLGVAAACDLIEDAPGGAGVIKEPASYAAQIFESPHDDSRVPVADWQRVDRALRTLARRRATLDADEARWLREAEACLLWRHVGMVSAIDYMERVLGYGPRVAQDRLRVARALGPLPQLTEALATG